MRSRIRFASSVSCSRRCCSFWVGIAQHLDVPVKLVRLITVLAMIFGLFFFVLVAYMVI
jgi:hypothetical protein